MNFKVWPLRVWAKHRGESGVVCLRERTHTHTNTHAHKHTWVYTPMKEVRTQEIFIDFSGC